MIREAMQHADLALFPSVALTVFAFWTALVLAWLYRTRSSEFYRNLSLIPLEGERTPQPGEHPGLEKRGAIK